MPVAQLASPLSADQGAKFTFTITWTLQDGSPACDHTWTAAWEWVDANPPPPLTGIVVADGGTITVTVPAAVTSAWEFAKQRFRLFMSQPGQDPLVLLDGTIVLDTGR